ncbi:MAG: aminotransferase class V-fold PLP-dependent enzyme [Pseudomonadota bacterium]|nr:aminotransferase class V-fold PLP-dependent enzyme [Pseudomonadota bacterium]
MIPSQRDLFDIPRDRVYLNTAYMGPMPKSAVAAGQASYAAKGRPWDYSAREFFDLPDTLRERAAQVFGATAGDIAIVPSVSYGLGTAARNLAPQKRSEILVLDGQFPSNVYVWRDLAEQYGARVVTVKRQAGEGWTAAVIRAIGPATAIVACPHVHWVDGGQLDLAHISETARRQGAALVLDLTQSLGALPFDMAAIQPDFAVAAGYKWLLGPYALGVLYVAPHQQAEGEPLEHNWIAREGAENFARLIDYTDAYGPGAKRFDMGERSAMQLVPAAIDSMERILDWGVDNIAQTLAARTAAIAEATAPLGLADDMPERAPHYLTLGLPEGAPGDLPARLAARNIHISQRGDRLRITPHLFNDDADITAFADGLRAVL